MPKSLESESTVSAEEGEIRREIVNEPIELFLDPTFYDVGWEPEPGELEEAQAVLDQIEEETPTLSYVPFDESEEFRKARQLSDEELTLPKDEQRRLRRERIAEFKEKQATQREGLAITVGALRKLVEEDPDVSSDALMEKVVAYGQEYRFSYNQLGYFELAIDSYVTKHTAVEKYRGLYPNNENLYEACFGRRPQGAIDVVKGPMTLYFSCLDEDYAYAYNFYKTQGEEAKFSEADKKQALNSSGAALSSVGIEELRDVVTLENALNHLRYEVVERQETITELERGDETTLYLDAQKDNVEIAAGEYGSWRIEIVERFESGAPSRFRLVDTANPDQPPLFDVVSQAHVDPDKSYLKLFKDAGTPEPKIRGNVGVNLVGNGKVCGFILMDPVDLKIKSNLESGLVVTSYEKDYVFQVDPALSEATRIHEDQHQFNKLFQPLESYCAKRNFIQSAIEGSQNADEAVEKIVQGFVRQQRRIIGVDASARGEILSYLQAGRTPESIYETLTTSELYDYTKKYSEQIARIPSLIGSTIKDNLTEAFYSGSGDESYLVDANALEIDEAMVKPYVDGAFGEEYKADLKMWLDAVDMLIDCGYSGNILVDLLYHTPANRWPSLARQVKRLKDTQEKAEA